MPNSSNSCFLGHGREEGKLGQQVAVAAAAVAVALAVQVLRYGDHDHHHARGFE